MTQWTHRSTDAASSSNPAPRKIGIWDRLKEPDVLEIALVLGLIMLCLLITYHLAQSIHFPKRNNIQSFSFGWDGTFPSSSTSGSGNVRTESRSVGDFSKIEVSGSWKVKVSVGPATSVTVTADDNIQPLVETKVTSGVLKITQRGSYSTYHEVKVEITVPDLQALSSSGSGDIKIEELHASPFILNDDASGNIVLEGQTPDLTIKLDGSGNVDATKLLAQKADVQLTGSGNVNLMVTQSLKAKIDRGSGNIEYSGNPQIVDQQTEGSGRIQPQE